MKAVGMIAILISMLGIGVARTILQKNRINICTDLLSLCDDLLIDLNYKVTPVTYFLQSISKKYSNLNFITNELLQNKCEINLPLSKNEVSLITSFVHSLGKCDVESQKAQIMVFYEQMERVRNKYIDNYNKDKKLNLSVSLFCGLTICLVIA